MEEDAFEIKRPAGQEELKELEKKRKWEMFKLGHKNRPKRKIVEENTIPDGWKLMMRFMSCLTGQNWQKKCALGLES